MKIRYLIISFMIFLATFSFAAIKDFSKDDWVQIFQEINAPIDSNLIDKLSQSSATLDNVNMQTRGALRTDEWITIFQKLGIEPKKDMQLQDWQKLFNRIGINTKSNISQDTANLSQEEHRTIAVDTMPQNIPQTEFKGLEKLSEKISNKSTKISLDLREADIFSVLKIISQKSDLNIIANNNIKRTVTIYLKDIDAIEALKIILEMNDLAYVYENNVIKVMTCQDYEKIYGKSFYNKTVIDIFKLNFGKADNISKILSSIKSKICQIIPDSASNSLIIIDTPENISELKKVIEELDVRIETKTLSLNYSKAKDISEKIKALLTPNISNIQIDERSNQIIITDTPKKIDEISNLVNSLDKRHKEVLIEAKIIQLIHSNEFKAGISWESIFSKINNNNMSGKVIGNLTNLTQPKNIIVGGENGIQLSVGTIESNNFSAVFDILQSIGKTNLVASPRIAAIENQEAKILIGTKEAYITTQVTNPGSTTSNPIVAESVNFVDVGMKLFVTPSIGDDGFITMKIKPELSSVDRILRTSQNNPIPIVRTSESETTVMVKDNISIVIAGLIEEKEIKKFEGVPILCQIPIIGIPFRRTSTEKVKTELIVFLTPRIMTGDIVSEEYKSKR